MLITPSLPQLRWNECHFKPSRESPNQEHQCEKGTKQLFGQNFHGCMCTQMYMYISKENKIMEDIRFCKCNIEMFPAVQEEYQ